MASLQVQRGYTKAMQELNRQVLLYQDEDGFWVAEVPSLPGCNTQGHTRDEALANVREAIELYLESLADDGIPAPLDSQTAEVVRV